MPLSENFFLHAPLLLYIAVYDNVCCKNDNEIRFLHDPDGISDLEYNLIENPNRHNSSHSMSCI